MLKRKFSDEELRALIDTDDTEPLFKEALKVRRENYGDDVYIRGLIEFTNYCRNNCYYCGIQRGNTGLSRYRLTHDDILECTEAGYELGFRTFVLQGGEDLTYTDKEICGIVHDIKAAHPDCAVTLSIGEKDRKSYAVYKSAGADRYLLRHETAEAAHYAMLHPAEMSLENRKSCLWALKELGYQVGSGFMVGSPYQTIDNLVSDLRFLEELEPDMIGIGPFLPHADTPFRDKEKGSLKRCVNLIAVLRLMFPYALIPSTTALGTIHPEGREMGLRAGANVVMPNLSPPKVSKLYTLYDNKLCTGAEAAQNLNELRAKVEAAGFRISIGKGNVREH
ncbi:MAG: [FeFe] hydrogenase H-cluster radical SAM maturase HydE [bacterium]|nr:[FeFe] hydrogenase H-cluster radical SAM maturase HydE [bacterium]